MDWMTFIYALSIIIGCVGVYFWIQAVSENAWALIGLFLQIFFLAWCVVGFVNTVTSP